MVRKKQKQKAKTKVYIAVGVSVGVIIIALIIAVACGLFSGKKYKLDQTESIYVHLMKTAIAMDRVNGAGDVNIKTCRAFKDLAKAYDSNTDWFSTSYCRYTFYADYIDTEKTSTVTLYGDGHAAVYTFDNDIDYLLDYKFIESAEKGRSISIED